MINSYESECKGKRGYTKQDAKKILKQLQSSSSYQRKPGKLNVYNCHYCDWWHVGHLNSH